jgi:HlyD family secretion protein
VKTLRINQLEQSVDRQEANRGVMQGTLDRLLVRAPIAGTLTSLTAVVGELKTPGANLGQIDAPDGIKLRVEIDQHYFNRVFGGQEATAGLGNQAYKLKVWKVYPEVVNGRFTADLIFDGPVPDGLRRGQTLNVRIALSQSEEALLLQRGNFYGATSGQWVYVLAPGGGKAVKRNIRLGRQNPMAYEVLEGLQPGDKVIISGYEGFNNMEELVFSSE